MQTRLSEPRIVGSRRHVLSTMMTSSSTNNNNNNTDELFLEYPTTEANTTEGVHLHHHHHLANGLIRTSSSATNAAHPFRGAFPSSSSTGGLGRGGGSGGGFSYVSSSSTAQIPLPPAPITNTPKSVETGTKRDEVHTLSSRRRGSSSIDHQIEQPPPRGVLEGLYGNPPPPPSRGGGINTVSMRPISRGKKPPQRTSSNTLSGGSPASTLTSSSSSAVPRIMSGQPSPRFVFAGDTRLSSFTLVGASSSSSSTTNTSNAAAGTDNKWTESSASHGRPTEHPTRTKLVATTGIGTGSSNTIEGGESGTEIETSNSVVVAKHSSTTASGITGGDAGAEEAESSKQQQPTVVVRTLDDVAALQESLQRPSVRQREPVDSLDLFPVSSGHQSSQSASGFDASGSSHKKSRKLSKDNSTNAVFEQQQQRSKTKPLKEGTKEYTPTTSPMKSSSTESSAEEFPLSPAQRLKLKEGEGLVLPPPTPTTTTGGSHARLKAAGSARLVKASHTGSSTEIPAPSAQDTAPGPSSATRRRPQQIVASLDEFEDPFPMRKGKKKIPIIVEDIWDGEWATPTYYNTTTSTKQQQLDNPPVVSAWGGASFNNAQQQRRESSGGGADSFNNKEQQPQPLFGLSPSNQTSRKNHSGDHLHHHRISFPVVSTSSTTSPTILTACNSNSNSNGPSGSEFMDVMTTSGGSSSPTVVVAPPPPQQQLIQQKPFSRHSAPFVRSAHSSGPTTSSSVRPSGQAAVPPHHRHSYGSLSDALSSSEYEKPHDHAPPPPPVKATTTSSTSNNGSCHQSDALVVEDIVESTLHHTRDSSVSLSPLSDGHHHHNNNNATTTTTSVLCPPQPPPSSGDTLASSQSHSINSSNTTSFRRRSLAS